MNNITFKQVGCNIQNVLEERSFTQQNLADKLNISKQVMSKIISGGKAINVLEIRKIAEVLNVPIDRLLATNGVSEPAHRFSFMGRINSEEVKAKISMLGDVIDEILFMEEYANER